MTWIEVESVTVDLPILDSHSVSLKKRVVAVMKELGGGQAAKPARHHIRALENVTFGLTDGDRVGLIGKNGSGKTTLLRVLAGIYEPPQGQVRVSGRTSTLLDLTFGLDMEATGIENIYLRGYAMGMSTRMIKGAEAGIIEFTELGERLADPVRTYSAGMILRLAFSISFMSPHEILLLDEVIGVGDASFIGKTRAKLASAITQSGIVVIASHAIDLIEGMCNKAIYLRDGRMIAFGPVTDVTSTFKREIAAGSV